MKQKLKLAWQIIVAAGMLSIILFIALILIDKKGLWERRGLIASCYETAYTQNFVIEHKGNYVRTKEYIDGKYLSPKLDKIYNSTNLTDTLTVFWKDDKRGYLNAYTGKIAIPAQFERAWVFSEGMGAVVKDGRLGFIDRNGNTVIPCMFMYINGYKSAKDFVFKGGYCTVFGEDKKQGIIDMGGNWVVEPLYDKINYPSKGYRLVKSGAKYGLFDSDLNLVLPIEYDDILVTDNGILVMHNGVRQMLAHDCKTVIDPLVIDYIETDNYYIVKDVETGQKTKKPVDYYYYIMSNKYGLMNPKTGKPITKAIYNGIYAVSPNLFSCRVYDGDGIAHNIIINGRGEIIK